MAKWSATKWSSAKWDSIIPLNGTVAGVGTLSGTLSGGIDIILPDIIVEAEFTAGVWTDISEWVSGFSSKRGRQKHLDHFQTGTFSMPLDNVDRRFDPFHATGPYAPNIKVGKRIRVRATHPITGVTHPVFLMKADSWPISWRASMGYAAVHGTDAFKDFALEPMDLPYDMEVLKDNPTTYLKLDEPDGLTAADSSGTNQHAIYKTTGISRGRPDPFVDGKNSAIGFIGREIPKIFLPTTTGVVGTEAFSIEFWIRGDRNDNAAGVVDRPIYLHNPPSTGPASSVVISLPSSGTGTIQFQINDATFGGAIANSSAMVLDGNWHHVVCRRNGTSLSVVVDKVLSGSATAAGIQSLDVPFIIRLGDNDLNDWAVSLDGHFTGDLARVAIYRGTELSMTRIGKHYDAASSWEGYVSGAQLNALLDVKDWSSADRDIDAGQVLMLGILSPESNVLAQAQLIEGTEHGALYIARDGKVVLRDRHAIMRAPYTTVQGTFGDGTGELQYKDILPIFDEGDIRNTVTITRKAGDLERQPSFVAVSKDATSIGTHKTREYSRTIASLNPHEASSLAGWILDKESESAPYFEVTLNPVADPALWDHVLGGELEDRVKVVGRPPGGGDPISVEGHIQSITHNVTGGPPAWETKWLVSPALPTTAMSSWGFFDDAVTGKFDTGVFAF
jgi:hypothetical protein